MITKIQQKLLQLSENTLTPETGRDYLANPDLISYIERTHRNVYKQYPSLDMLVVDVRAIIIFILKLMDAPINLQGILLTQFPVAYMIMTSMSNINATDQDMQSIDAVRNVWFDVIKNNQKKIVKFHMHKPYYENCPLMTFHIDAYQTALLPNNNVPLYEAYGFRLATDIRFNQNQKIDYSTHISYVRSARTFFKELSPDIKSLPDHPRNKIPTRYIEDLRANLIKKRGLDEKTATIYIKQLRELIKRKMLKPHPRISSRTSRNVKVLASSTPPDGTSASSSTPQFYIEGFKIEPPTDPYEMLDFVEDIDFANIRVPGNSKLLSTPEDSKTFKDFMDYVHVLNFTFFWDMKFLNLFHLSILYLAMDQALRKDNEDLRSIVLFIYLLIHTGIDAEKLLATVPIKENADTDTVGLKLINGQFYLLNPRIVPSSKSEDGAGCLQTSRHVHIPIPKIIAEMVPGDVFNREYLFSYFRNGREIHLDMASIRRFLESVNSAYSVYEMNITPDYIENSFLPLYSSRYGLDPIICCHISGQDPHALFGSQLHYVYVYHSSLANAYIATFNRVNMQIRRNLNECIASGLISGEKSTAIVEKPLYDKSKISGYGSRHTPSDNTARVLVERITNAILSEKNVKSRHNLFACYLFLGIQCSTGHRPRRRLIIPWTYYNEDSGILIIRDKDSSKHHEQRLLPLPAVIRALLSRVRSGLHFLKSYVERNLIISDQSEMNNNILFLVEDDGQCVDFSPDGMIRMLQNVSIDFPYPMNMFRHYLRFHLYQAGISNDLADAWMGHQRDGRELLNITSSTVIENAFSKCLPFVEDILLQTGFRDLEYLPT